MNMSIRMFILCSTFLLLMSCRSMMEMKVPDVHTIDEVGSVRTSVISVALWSDYKEALQPQFGLSTESALAAVIPTTQITETRTLDAVRALLRVALPTSVRSLESTTNDTDGSSTKNTREKKAGDITTTESSTELTNDIPSTLLDTSEKMQGSLEKSDPRLRYQAATALYQEVQLLDRAIRDVALREGYTPYVVRLQLGLMPRMRNLPYDAYINLAFFEKDDHMKKEELSVPIILPILATDSLEKSLGSDVLEQVRDLGISISALSQTAASANIGKLSRKLDSILGRDINSTFTMSRLSDNTIRVRMGAFQQGTSSRYAMVPRTETVTLLLMVRDEYVSASNEANKDQVAKANRRLIHVHSFSEMIHAFKGKSLGRKTFSAENQDLDYLNKQYGIDENLANELWELMGKNNWKTFIKRLNKECDNELMYCIKNRFTEPEQVWTELAGLQPSYTVETLRFQLPVKPHPSLFPQQTALLLDDKTATAVATLRGGTGLDSSNLWAFLMVDNNILPAIKTSLNDGGRVGAFSFDSLALWGLHKNKSRIKLIIENRVNQMAENNLEETYPIQYLAKSAPAINTGFTLAPNKGFIITKDDGTGMLKLAIITAKQKTASQIKITITGANLIKAYIDNDNKTSINHTGQTIMTGLADAGETINIALELGGLAVGKEALVVQSANEKDVTGEAIKFDVRTVKE